MSRRFRVRLWPRSVTARIALILLAALIATQIVGWVLFDRDRSGAALRLLTESLGKQIADIVAIVEDAGDAERAALIPVLNNPTLWVGLSDRAPVADPALRLADDDLLRAVRGHLPAPDDRMIEMWLLDHWRESDDLYRTLGFATAPDLMPSRRKLVMAIGLSDGGTLLFVAASERPSWRWAWGTAMWLGLSIGVVFLCAVWAARRVTAPLARFAAAADRLGVDVGAPPMPETGSAELRRATRAFNRMQERLRRLVEDRTQMLAAISHDLRTMLTRLRLRAEYIDDAEQREKALVDLDDMNAMLASTLAFARDDAADEPRETVDLAALVQSLCDDLADAGQPVTHDGPDQLVIACRPRALRRALANLIDNAVTYGGTAAVSLADRGDRVDIVIADRGPGIPDEAREAVFAPFHRLEGSRSRETGGTGLGLAVARAVARAHGGDITFADRPGGGLATTLTVPKADIRAESDAKPEPKRPKRAAN